jgi:hypothetical protein
MLLDELIGALSSQSTPITDALLRAKVFLHSISKQELVEWVNHELSGYPDEAILPPYRILHSQVHANFANLRARYADHPIPIQHLRADQKKNLENTEVRDSLSVIQDLSGASENTLRRNLPMEFNPLLSVGLGGGFQIEQAYCAVSTAEIRNIQFQVRSRLLDFMLDLKDSIGDAKNDTEVKIGVHRADPIGLFNNAIFGPNATVFVGDRNVNKNEINVLKGDLGSLVSRLKEIGIEEGEIDKLRDSLTSSEQEKNDQSLSQRVGDWIKDQALKQIELGTRTAVSFSADAVLHAVKAYFGS